MDEKAQMAAALRGDEALMPFGVGSPAEASQQPAGLSNFVGELYGSLENLAKHAIGNSQTALDTGTYNPKPALEAAMLPMGTGAVAGVPVKGAEAVLGAGPIRAYHGSPHDFDRFDVSKIGTGEGAQIYGHGLYFAENPAVAESYRSRLAGTPRIKFGDTTINTPSELRNIFPDLSTNVRYPMHHTLDQMQHGTSFEDALKYTKDQYSHYQPSDLAHAESLLRQHNPSLVDPRGKMYEVGIHTDPTHLLDLDKSLIEQGATGKRAFEAIHDKEPLLPPTVPGGAPPARGWITGMGNIQGPAQVAAQLREANIPGLRYLDQLSRNAGQGSSNYVMFNDKLIEILKKYGVAGVPASGVAAGAVQDQGPQ